MNNIAKYTNYTKLYHQHLDFFVLSLCTDRPLVYIFRYVKSHFVLFIKNMNNTH